MSEIMQIVHSYNQQITMKIMELLQLQQKFVNDVQLTLSPPRIVIQDEATAPCPEAPAVAIEAPTKNKHRKQRDVKTPSCSECGESNAAMFYDSRKSKCKACHCKDTGSRIKQGGTHKKGIERNEQEKISRKHCTDCKLEINTDNKGLFEWDHRNPNEKTYKVSSMTSMSDKDYYIELEKCDMVCRECHLNRTRKQREEGKIMGRPRKYKY